jgi:pimeloyl-ACP methyl ester carboxylesterase
MVDEKARLVRNCIATIEARKEGCWGPPWGDRFLGYLKSKLSLYESLEDSSNEVASIKSLGSLPLIVLTAGVPAAPLTGGNQEDGAEAAVAWHAMHERYARLSTRGVHRVVAGAAHMIQDEKPDDFGAAVAEAIASSRSRVPLGQPPRNASKD